jgi:hypothetical protein
MGDGKYGTQYLSLTPMSMDVNGETKIALRVEYRRGPEGWAGVYWQCPDGNWGDRPGMAMIGASGIAFLARGEQGGEVVEFKSGGIKGVYRDSFERSTGQVALSSRWQPYLINLVGADLSSVIGAFAWAAPSPQGGHIVFFIAELEIQ